MALLSKILGRAAPAKPNNIPGDTANSLPIAPPTVTAGETLRYPPYDRGFEAQSLASVLHGQQEIIERINRTAGMSSEDFEARCRPAIENLARYVHLLPATSTEYFRGEGGLLRMSLEIGLYAMQQASAAVFPIAGGVDRRYLIQPKWCFATFLAGICSQLYRPATHMAVVTGDGRQWPALMMPLTQWIEENNVDTYYVRWLDKANSVSGTAASAFLVGHIAPPALLQWLNDDNTLVLPALAAAAAGSVDTHENPIVSILAPTTTSVINDDVRRNPVNYGHLTVGMHLEPHIINAMRHLVRTGVWVPNKAESLLWTGADGTYLAWVRATEQITDFLRRDNFSGVPSDPEQLANILLQAGIATRRSLNAPYWTIMHPESGSIVEGNLKFSDANFLFTDQSQLPEDRTSTLVVEPKAPSSTPPKKAPKATTAPVQAQDATSGPAQLDLLGGDPVPVPASAVPPKASSPVASSAPQASPTGNTEPNAPTADVPIPTPAEVAPTPSTPETGSKTIAKGAKGAGGKRDSAPGKNEPPVAKPSLPPVTQAASASDPVPSVATPAEPEPVAAPAVPLLGPAAEKLLSELKPDSAVILRIIVHGFRAKALTGQVMVLDHGIAITQHELLAHGMHFKDLLEELWTKKWLWIDNTKPTRQLHPMKQGELDIRVLILRPKIGAQIFELDEASRE